jgi:hypothetical protein
MIDIEMLGIGDEGGARTARASSQCGHAAHRSHDAAPRQAAGLRRLHLPFKLVKKNHRYFGGKVMYKRESN